MTVSIKPDSKVSSLRKRLGHGSERKRLLKSEERRSYLQGVGRMISKEQLRVMLHGGGAFAAPDDDVTRPNNDFIIAIPSEPHDQPETDLPPKAWDLLFQETELFHELGHVLYTNWEAWEEARQDVGTQHPGYVGWFKNVFNAAEDGRIETQLSERFNIADDLVVKNANLVAISNQKRSAGFDFENSGGTVTYNFREAIEIGLLDMGYYDSGRFAAMLDPSNDDHVLQDPTEEVPLLENVKPLMESFMTEMLAERDGADAVELTKEFFLDLVDELGNEADRGAKDESSEERPDDADSEVRNGSEDAEDLPEEQQIEIEIQVPAQGAEEQDEEEEQSGGGGAGDSGDEEEDEEEGAGAGEQDDSEESGDTDDSPAPHEGQDHVREDDTDAEGGGDPTDGPDVNTDDEEEGEGSGEDGDDEEDEDGSGGDDVGADSNDLDEAEDEVTGKYNQEVKTEQSSVDSETVEEAEAAQMVSMMAGGGPVQEVVMLHRDDYDDDWDREAWLDAKRMGSQLADVLERKLQRELESDYRRGQKYGRLDSQSLHSVAAGNDRVFTQKSEPEEKDYSCTIVLDRSGSMGDTRMPAAEKAAGMLAYGLEEVGADVSVMGMHRNTPKIEKPFGGEIETFASNVFGRNVAGGTPLKGTVEIAKERLEQQDGQNFLVVITDGEPRDEEGYQRLIGQCDFPVLGVYVNENESTFGKHHQYFDEIQYATPPEVAKKVRALGEDIMF
jgi:hypothetical protein